MVSLVGKPAEKAAQHAVYITYRHTYAPTKASEVQVGAVNCSTKGSNGTGFSLYSSLRCGVPLQSGSPSAAVLQWGCVGRPAAAPAILNMYGAVLLPFLFCRQLANKSMSSGQHSLAQQ